MGRISEFTDVISGLSVAAALLPWSIGEQTIAETQLKRLNRSVLVGSMRIDVLKTLSGELSSEEFARKFKKLAQRVTIPVRPGRSYSREGVGKPKRFFQVPRVC
jgi:hypothetical protein